MNTVVIATIVFALLLVVLLFFAARKGPLEQVAIRVYKPPKSAQIFIEIRSRKFGRRRHEFYLLTPEQAEVMADKLLLHAYAARNHLELEP